MPVSQGINVDTRIRDRNVVFSNRSKSQLMALSQFDFVGNDFCVCMYDVRNVKYSPCTSISFGRILFSKSLA